jgi:Raf kinase inhibitor-like YbhB/YbcL family protein
MALPGILATPGLRAPAGAAFMRREADPMAFTLTTPAFEDGGVIPQQFTCDGDNLPPPLGWSDPPEGTRSFALIMDDPDAPSGTFTHWLLYDIPARVAQMPGEAVGKSLRNDFGRSGYGGPCPPPGHGPHRYFFTLYAMDVPTQDVKGESRKSLEDALRGHTLATARLMGIYERR